MKNSWLIVVILLAGAPIYGQVLRDSFEVEGHTRSFNFIAPPKAKASLVFVLHGSNGNGQNMMGSAKQLIKLAETENILLVFPDGYQRYWNECRGKSPAVANVENINENDFFAGMVSYFRKKYDVDIRNTFAVGTSGGGHMAYKLALTMPEQFRAVTAIVANLPDSVNLDCPQSGKPVSVMIINGADDSTNPWNGGLVQLGNGMSMGVVRSAAQTFAYWAGLAGYHNKPRHDHLPDTDPSDGKTIERFAFSAKGKEEVILLKVIGGKHEYPNDIDVHEEAWKFFKRHRIMEN